MMAQNHNKIDTHEEPNHHSSTPQHKDFAFSPSKHKIKLNEDITLSVETTSLFSLYTFIVMITLVGSSN